MDHSFDIQFAKEYGINAAILYRNFQFWISINKANNKHLRDGRTWAYFSMRALADLHSYMNFGDVRAALLRLSAGENSILIKGNLNKNQYDRTLWYAFRDEKTALTGLPRHLLNAQMDLRHAQMDLRHAQMDLRHAHNDTNTNDNTNTDYCNMEIARRKLDLDLLIKQKRDKFMKSIADILHPNRKEAVTFARITKHLVKLCQDEIVKPDIFDQATNWAIDAKAVGKNPKGLFVSIIKKKTKYRGRGRLLT